MYSISKAQDAPFVADPRVMPLPRPGAECLLLFNSHTSRCNRQMACLPCPGFLQL